MSVLTDEIREYLKENLRLDHIEQNFHAFYENETSSASHTIKLMLEDEELSSIEFSVLI